MIHSLAILVFFIPANALAADDVIKEELDKARVKYSESLNTAKNKFIAAMDVKLKDVAKTGDLDGAIQVKAQKELFEKDGTLPKSPHLLRAKADYESEIKVAMELLRKSLELAKVQYTKALKLNEAQALAAELKALAIDPKAGTLENPDVLNAKFAAGSVWKGTGKEKRPGGELTTDVVLTVTKRKDSDFEGTYEVGDGKYVYLVQGSIRRDQVTFKYAKIEKQPKDSVVRNLIGVEHKGSLGFDPRTKKPTLTTNYTWRNVNNTGVVAQGTVTLIFEK